MHFKEIEFKFDAENITLNDFIKTVEKMSPKKHVMVSSYDDYFINDEGNFIRYRHNNQSQELTIKRKIHTYNNNERIEINLPIVTNVFNNVQAFVNLLGYQHNFRIYKICNIFWVKNVVLSYYIVYNENMDELNRFIEIEANEYEDFASEEEAMCAIKSYEEKFKHLGLHHKKRLKRSLFELYQR